MPSSSIHKGEAVIATICRSKKKVIYQCMISGFCHNVNEICALLWFYAAKVGRLLSTFWNNVSVPSSRVKQSAWPLKMWSPKFMLKFTCCEKLNLQHQHMHVSYWHYLCWYYSFHYILSKTQQCKNGGKSFITLELLSTNIIPVVGTGIF
jgi:hypothetical protein